jgi:hypothetical protein
MKQLNVVSEEDLKNVMESIRIYLQKNQENNESKIILYP